MEHINGSGVLFDGSESGYLEDNYIHGCDEAVKLYNESWVDLIDNHFRWCDYGLYITGMSVLDLCCHSGTEVGENWIKDCYDYLFYADDASDGHWGDYSQSCGNNSIYYTEPSGTWYYGYIGGYSLIDAERNWWGGTPYEYRFDIEDDGESDIDYTPYRNSAPKTAVSLQEKLAKDLHNAALRQSKSGNYKDGWDKYKEVIKKYPSSVYAKSSLLRMQHLRKKLQDEDFIKYLYEVIERNDAVKEIAVHLSISNLLENNYIIDAVESCDYLIKNYPESSLKDFAIFKLFRINLEYLGDTRGSEKLLSKLKEADTRKNYSKYAEGMLNDFKKGKLKRKLSDSEIANIEYNRLAKSVEELLTNTDTEIPGEFGLLSNYPNPFNPVTKIRFALPEVSNVQIAIYNMLGQQVASLVNSRMSAGFKEISWDGTNHASGMYILKMEAGGFSKAMKIMLVK